MPRSDDPADRPLKPAMLRGAMRRCPSCGQGALFHGYLTVRDQCDHCGEDMSHQRADDGPAYLTILLVSHLGAPLLLAVYMAWRPSAMSMLIGFSLGAVILSLLLLPLIKGAFVGFQWARRMHGFGAAPRTLSA
ncbi:DUF983 domain-containing protein [Paracoccus laeviglucosivorans]|uniref:Uncharacterized conserved protein, DUF983 family n=1 Tax=Paracoccus laeviglucosivorans TaxID=1197861 RepID=A0A521C734_9RHOB|nr:DUF983 domain-containing protein [Paracoccus laeviglucosivorans]SMO55282.1 Uncharacterized conserved protein, DUF983 family [Paracoccus laeviglucosivorans]